ncbi:hypothetical protein [uncultured Kordia sp.]|uniref:hypothetical protein n=1 Tax=uncultured Kordia sp. TaxID=507699 RepID=UPI0026155974|nr:hypothetical protein [uncultured Kordia sp.]
MGKPNLVIDRVHNKLLLNGEVVGEVYLSGRDNWRFQKISTRRSDNIIVIDEIDNFVGVKTSNIFDQHIQFIIISSRKELENYFNNIFMNSYVMLKKRGYENGLELFFSADSKKWNFNFSLKLFTDTFFQSLLKNQRFLYAYDGQIDENKIIKGILLYKSIDKQKDINILYYEVINLLKLEIESIISRLTQEQSIKSNNLTNTFTFPPEIQSSCEQYLIYFATFLKDIGINAETNIESKAHETLFTVIPENGEEALDNIKEALQMYLSLPESPEFESIVTGFLDVGAQQLASQVLFLKSQLMMANSAIQLKDATIKSLNMTIYQQSLLIEKDQTKKENEEKFAGGLVRVGELKIKNFTFDLPELLRRIKRKFK